MSFILDALRKSESERQRLGTTSMADLPLGRRQSRPWWIGGIAALLLANLILLAVVMLRPAATPESVAASPTTAAVAASSASRATTPPPQTSSQLSSHPNNSQSSSASLADDAMTSPQIQYDTVDRATMEAASAVPDGPTLVRSTRADATSLDTAPEALPPLRIDMHVYSPQRDGRFVLINMHKYVEGQTLQEGPVVEQITTTGVVLRYQNRRWELDRP